MLKIYSLVLLKNYVPEIRHKLTRQIFIISPQKIAMDPRLTRNRVFFYDQLQDQNPFNQKFESVGSNHAVYKKTQP